MLLLVIYFWVYKTIKNILLEGFSLKQLKFFALIISLILLNSYNIVFSMSENFANDEKSKDDIIVLYSGGLDSSALVARCGAYGYKRVHMLTFDNGAMDKLDMSKIKLDEFRDKFPNTEFIHKILSSKYFFKKISLLDIEDDILIYKTNLVCVGCKMAMHALALVYAKKNNIKLVIDGFVKRQEDFPEQDLSFINEIKALYKEYAVDYRNPLYNIVTKKEDVKSILSEYDLSTKSIEPECLFGYTFSKSKSENIKNYISNKIELTKEYIDKLLKESEMFL